MSDVFRNSILDTLKYGRTGQPLTNAERNRSDADLMASMRSIQNSYGDIGGGLDFQTFAVMTAIMGGAIDLAKAITLTPPGTSDTKFLFGVWFSVSFWYMLKKTNIVEQGIQSVGDIVKTAVGETGEVVQGVGEIVPL